MMANDCGLDFERIRQGLTHDYPRAADMPGAGFAAGPCLFKDTMQLAAFNNNNFALGHAAMMINEGLPLYLVHRLEQRFDLSVDDGRHPRHGLQGRVRRHQVQPVATSSSGSSSSRPTRCCAPTRTSPSTRTCCRWTRSSRESDLLVIGAPHPEYRDLVTDKPVADIWNVLGDGRAGMT